MAVKVKRKEYRELKFPGTYTKNYLKRITKKEGED